MDEATICENFDECLSDPCVSDLSSQVCTDIDGSYECSCGSGYSGLTVTGNIAECTDVNECENEPSPCFDENSVQDCENIPGSFVCSCGQGYSGQSGTDVGIRNLFNPSVPESVICVGYRLREIDTFRTLRGDCLRPIHCRISLLVSKRQ